MIRHLITWLLQLYVLVLIAAALLSWFPVSPGTFFASVVRFFGRITEPVLRPVRRVLPPIRAGGTSIDLSVIVAIIVIQVVIILINR